MDTAALPMSTNRPVPVALHEAALDSPTFRSTCNHFGEQIDAVEKWLSGYVSSTSKLVHDILALEDTINSFLTKTALPASDGLLDSDYTALAVKRVGDGSREWLTQMLGGMKRMDNSVVEPIRSFISGDLRNFKEIRRILEQSQKTYDSTLSRYVGQHKTKEPSAIREDAFSVYESRKAYVQSAMDFCQLAPQLRSTIDKLLVKVCSELWKEMRGARDAATNATRYNREMERIRGWSKELENSDVILRKELQASRKSICDATIEGFKPSRELEDYNTATVPFLSSRGPANLRLKDDGAVISEKQGWLFLRMLSNKPTRYTWVRRWHYCRDGVFGWLVPGSHGVLQGDEIGVLLCNARPAVGEERRFCFEIKTNDQTMMLQAESQRELTEWLEVFEVTKKKAFETTRDTRSVSGADPAFSINPPSAPEFSAKAADAHTGAGDDPAVGFERAGTLPVPGTDGNLMPRQSFDVSSNAPRRSFSALGRDLAREDGESNREHAARIMQRLDMHRKSTVTPDAAGTGLASSGSGIASLISASHNVLPGYANPLLSPNMAKRANTLPLIDSKNGSLAPSTLAKPPAITSLSRAAVVHAADRPAAGENGKRLPTSLVANYWGSNVWGTADSPQQPVLPRLHEDDPIGVVLPEGAQTSLSPSSKEKAPSELLPANYPPELRLQNAQFRLLFPDALNDEKLVLVFRGSWSSLMGNDSDKGSLTGDGRVYVTPENMYFYSQQMGLITTYSMNLDIITEVNVSPGRDLDYLTLHLGHGADGNPYSEIKFKVYLEDVQLLQARLNLIIDNLQAEEPTDTSNLISALISIEKAEDNRPSPSVDSWEDVSPNTPIDGGRPFPKFHDTSPRLRTSQSRQDLVPKIHLPTHPVAYEPENMKEMAAERHFEISAKACFHVLFGDKSFVFPKLYFEHRAQQITQGPWVLVDQGRMRREFHFKVDYVDMLGRSRAADVKDHQTIDLYSDHVTYVVTHAKTAWHLPHSNSFKLISKVVITHVAKSKCKLAIWVKIDWSRTPALSKNLVERQALRDVVSEAEELAELATDQVRKLGSRSRTNRAIQVYGHVGQQTQVVVFSPGSTDSSKKQVVKPRTLTSMVFETVRSFGESCITSVIMWVFAGGKKLVSIITAQRLILVLLLMSGLTNLLLTSSGTSTWWQERSAARFMRRIGISPNTIMSKAIYIADLDEAAGSVGVEPTFPGNSTCFDTFRELLQATDVDAPWEDAGSNLSSRSSRSTARRLRRTRQRLGSYRHDLVVAMRVVNNLEREVLQSEWENWLSNEKALCDSLEVLISGGNKGSKRDKSDPMDAAQKRLGDFTSREELKTLKDFGATHCGSCRADFDLVMGEQRFDGGLRNK